MEVRRLTPASPVLTATEGNEPDAVRVGDRSFAQNHMHLDVRRTP
jgi:hypothetical protein